MNELITEPFSNKHFFLLSLTVTFWVFTFSKIDLQMKINGGLKSYSAINEEFGDFSEYNKHT